LSAPHGRSTSQPPAAGKPSASPARRAEREAVGADWRRRDAGDLADRGALSWTTPFDTDLGSLVDGIALHGGRLLVTGALFRADGGSDFVVRSYQVGSVKDD
jgi:hypothetical protein